MDKNISTEAQRLVIDICDNPETKKNPAMVAAVAELYKAIRKPIY